MITKILGKRKAIIDLGTNTFNLLVVDTSGQNYKTVYAAKEGVGLGLGGINDSRISADAMGRGIEALNRYKQKCSELGVEQIHLFGTSAIRSAVNRNDFLDRVKSELQLDIEVVTGEREAQLIYKGVSSGMVIDEPILIMDIGGGSTEFIQADSSGPVKFRSFEIGVSRIYQLFDFSDPFCKEDCLRIEDYLEKGTGDFFDGMNIKHLVGASGSFETFYELSTESRYPEGDYVQLTRAEIMQSLDHIIGSTLHEREKNEWIIPIRKKMAPVAAVKIRWIILKLNIQHVTISPFSLKEGVLQTLT